MDTKTPHYLDGKTLPTNGHLIVGTDKDGKPFIGVVVNTRKPRENAQEDQRMTVFKLTMAAEPSFAYPKDCQLVNT